MKHLIVLIVIFSSFAYAEDSVSTDSSEPGFFAQMGQEFVSPVTTKVRPYFFAGSLLTLTLAIFEDQIDDPIQKDVATDKPLGRTSEIGNIAGQMVPNVLYMIGMYSHYLWTSSELSKERSVHMFKSTAYSSVLTTILKYSIREPRPNSSDRASFPSGHTTTAFAFASVVAVQHGWWWGVPAFGLATLTGASRMNDNFHYFHDVIGGAVIGLSYGLSLYYLNYADKDKTSMTYVEPIRSGALLNWVATF